MMHSCRNSPCPLSFTQPRSEPGNGPGPASRSSTPSGQPAHISRIADPTHVRNLRTAVGAERGRQGTPITVLEEVLYPRPQKPVAAAYFPKRRVTAPEAARLSIDTPGVANWPSVPILRLLWKGISVGSSAFGHAMMEVRMARTGPSKAVLILDDEERDTLSRWARRPSSPQSLALRSKIVLACGEG
jgi:hypothetical protein